jgi:hypothetical protein
MLPAFLIALDTLGLRFEGARLGRHDSELDVLVSGNVPPMREFVPPLPPEEWPRATPLLKIVENRIQIASWELPT